MLDADRWKPGVMIEQDMFLVDDGDFDAEEMRNGRPAQRVSEAVHAREEVEEHDLDVVPDDPIVHCEAAGPPPDRGGGAVPSGEPRPSPPPTPPCPREWRSQAHRDCRSY